MRDYGYDISDYCAIDPLFGTMADFDTLVKTAHDLGLKLIVDQVYSHTSIDHAWFTESRADRTNPKADWYVWADPKPDGSPPTNWLAAFGGGMWEWDSRRRQYFLHNFLPSQPDLNLHNREVQDAILDVARFWLDRGVDGFRLDVANCYTHDRQLRDNPPSGARNAVRPYFMQRHMYDRDQPETFPFAARLRQVVDEKPGRFMLAELASDDPEGAIADYTAGDDRFHTAYAFRFLVKPFSARIIRDGVEDLLKRAPEAWPSWAFSNHDFERVASRWGAGKPMPLFAKTLFALLTSLRGTAFVYQGEELGLPQADVPFEALRDPDGIAFWPAYKGRDGCRTPMPWTRGRGGRRFHHRRTVASRRRRPATSGGRRAGGRSGLHAGLHPPLAGVPARASCVENRRYPLPTLTSMANCSASSAGRAIRRYACCSTSATRIGGHAVERSVGDGSVRSAFAIGGRLEDGERARDPAGRRRLRPGARRSRPLSPWSSPRRRR